MTTANLLKTLSSAEGQILPVNAIRALAIDAVQRANSGHPGTPMGLAPIGFALWAGVLRHSPKHPEWFNRDRFVLSCGHASMLLYALLHLSGYDLPMAELKRFRQMGSHTPGHPERDISSGIEVTTGPLGQGFGNAVGMAIAERILGNTYNRDGFNVVDHNTWVLASDGDLMEGVTAESASLAGNLNLGKLVCIYDQNDITIEGKTSLAFREDVGARFRSYGWRVIEGVDGDDHRSVGAALEEVVSSNSVPTIVIAHTTIGFGSPNKAGKASVHGEPLGEEEAKLAKAAIGWKWEPFQVPQEAYEPYQKNASRGEDLRKEWLSLLTEYEKIHPGLAESFRRDIGGTLPDGWDEDLNRLASKFNKPIATRVAGGNAIEAIVKRAPTLVGGSADLGKSNNTLVEGRGSFLPETPSGRNIHYGVREHAMGAITNGISAHQGLIPYAATFLVFSDYMRAAIRLSAISNLKAVWIFTHDSIGLGEDGPTHQPVSHLMSLRMIPGLTVIRPADGRETIGAWHIAVGENDGPTAIILARQKTNPLPVSDTNGGSQVAKGAYIVKNATEPDAIIIATGSEVAPSLEAAELLKTESINVRLVSMPSWELFEKTSEDYKESVLPVAVKARVSVEAGIKTGWERYVLEKGTIMGLDGFGISAPGPEVMAHFNFTPKAIAESVKDAITRCGG